ncbi:uracil-DNA glycosylase family protein [Paenibacillus sp. HB172176]|uniref:uracil-DNA glycosylase family protein n=1 Tax=Paenibacillus sp. HB172176 TaxID=2493690 RepID=UPI001F104B80|nr:uracil-DNA glycosylase family protein [Paenibacillus sp. HB172176]
MELEALKREIEQCQDCKGRFGFPPKPIVHGHARSKMMQISQAPSRNVHLTGKAFNDLSGDTLKYKWYEITDEVFYDEDNFYITAISHCFPGKKPKGGDNPPPLSCARKWLEREMQLVDNELYIVIGARAAKFLFGNRSFEELIFANQVLKGKPAIVLPHPSPLNNRWFKKHPEFEAIRLPEIREQVLSLLER